MPEVTLGCFRMLGCHGSLQDILIFGITFGNGLPICRTICFCNFVQENHCDRNLNIQKRQKLWSINQSFKALSFINPPSTANFFVQLFQHKSPQALEYSHLGRSIPKPMQYGDYRHINFIWCSSRIKLNSSFDRIYFSVRVLPTSRILHKFPTRNQSRTHKKILNLLNSFGSDMWFLLIRK